MTDRGRKDDVGYGKPPRHTRFQKGQSGNPKGRPKGSRNISTLVERALRKPITITEAGERRTMSRAEAIATRLISDALSGKHPAQKLVIEMDRELELRQQRKEEIKAAGTEARNDTDRRLIETYLRSNGLNTSFVRDGPPNDRSEATVEPLEDGAVATDPSTSGGGDVEAPRSSTAVSEQSATPERFSDDAEDGTSPGARSRTRTRNRHRPEREVKQ
ncbi:MAG: DUF5681 domain-containing protein [Minwuia sp.]|uniref:DUF5681 domain-containing protein n=1 Tax=Minwuia sp. TaxID=2493630 RepID=UPI003A8525B5